MSLDAATFLFVPPAPSSTMNKSASTIAAPISVPPSMSSLDIAKLSIATSSPINLLSDALNFRNLPSVCAEPSTSTASLIAPIPPPPLPINPTL